MKHSFKANIVAFLIALTIGSQHLYGGATFFGTTGLTFIPTAEILPLKSIVVSYFNQPGSGYDVTLIPYSVRWGFALTRPRIEVLFTNVYVYANRRNGVNVKNIGFPLIPSFKYQVAEMSPSTKNTAMAFGVTTPYGAFYAYDRHLRKPSHLTLHAGIATKLTTYHFLSGLTVHFGKEGPGYTHHLPFRITVEGAWGGSLKNLTENEESFLAISSIYQWTQNLTVDVFVRYDSKYGRFDPLTQMGIGLSYMGVSKW